MQTDTEKPLKKLPQGVMFNAYPDSIGSRLADTVSMLKRPDFRGVFSLFYILPTFFNSDLDRGFSIIDYELNQDLVSVEDLEGLSELKVLLKFDLVLNHLSVGSPQFRDLLKYGDKSEYKDFFIDWNEFWKSDGEMGPDRYIIPRQDHLQKLFMRKPGLPILKVQFPDGSERPYWNTFYQQVDVVNGQRTYLGQMDLNARSEKVWCFYEETFKKLKSYGATLIRLDAFAYLHKQPGRVNFFNKPETWQYLDRLREMANRYDLILLPEIHSEYGTKLHQEVSDAGFPIYDFFFPGLVIDALDRGTSRSLLRWIDEILERKMVTINMLGCHDGIPVLDLRGSKEPQKTEECLLSDEQIDQVVERIIERGGRVKNLYGPDGKKIAYYQVNATFFSALGEDPKKLLLARAIQMFMPGIPQVWYLDLFAGKNNYQAADRGGAAGHKEINRTTLSMAEVEQSLKDPLVQKQLELIRLRNCSPAFQGKIEVGSSSEHHLIITWRNGSNSASLKADLRNHSFEIDQQG